MRLESLIIYCRSFEKNTKQFDKFDFVQYEAEFLEYLSCFYAIIFYKNA